MEGSRDDIKAWSASGPDPLPPPAAQFGARRARAWLASTSPEQMTGRLPAVSGGCSGPPGAGATSSRGLHHEHTSSMGPLGGVGHVSAACGASPVVSGLPLNPTPDRQDQGGKGKGLSG